MTQDTANLPGIRRAALLIARDNGMINREHDEAEFLEQCDEVLGAEGVNLIDLILVDAFLMCLTDDQLGDLCCGGEGEPEQEAVLAMWQWDRSMLTGLLNDIFEGPHSDPLGAHHGRTE